MELRKLLHYAAPYRGWLLLSMGFMSLETIVALALPWLGGRFAGGLFAAEAAASGPLLTAMLTLFALQASLKLGNSYLMGRTSARVLADLRAALYDHLQSLPLGFFHRQRHGDIVALVTHEIAQFAGFISTTMIRVVPLLLTAGGAMILMGRIAPSLAAFVVLAIPLFFLALKLIGRRLRPLASQLQKADATAVAISTENLSMVGLIKIFTRESLESVRYRTQLARVTELSDKQHFVYSLLEPTTQFLTAASVVVVLWLASNRVNAGAMSPAELVSFLLYAAVLTRPIADLAALYGQAQLTRGTLARLQLVLAEQAEPSIAHGLALPAIQGEIEFRNIRFGYSGRAETLRGISLRIRQGETVAVTGRNGSGKSTLVHLLLRLHEPLSGQILVDGTDIADINLHSLRSQIAIVPQHVLLFNGTARENIAYALHTTDHAAIERAARLAQAHDFVQALPEGYDTQLGDNGVRLSGGQRQRIALARALLKNPRVLILDEATSMFDAEGEQAFIESARQAMALHTVIIITHRQATLKLADRVVHLEDGQLTCAQQTQNCGN